jgi:hypothetical protein
MWRQEWLETAEFREIFPGLWCRFPTENRKVTGSTPVGATTGKHLFFGTGAFLL